MVMETGPELLVVADDRSTMCFMISGGNRVPCVTAVCDTSQLFASSVFVITEVFVTMCLFRAENSKSPQTWFVSLSCVLCEAAGCRRFINGAHYIISYIITNIHIHASVVMKKWRKYSPPGGWLQ